MTNPESKWLYVYSVVVLEINGRRTTYVRCAEYHPNVSDGMSFFYYCEPWEAPKVGEYVAVQFKYEPSNPPTA